MECFNDFRKANETNSSSCLSVTETAPSSYKNLFDMNYPLAVIYVTITAAISVSGLFGNAFILYMSKKEKNLNQTGKMFVRNMSLADLCVSGIANPMCIVAAVLGKEKMDDVFILCEMVACMCLTACVCAFLNITFLTINRYIFICRNTIYHKIFTNASTIIMCGSTWILSFALEAPNFIGWGGHSFDKKSHQCIWDRTASRSYTLFVSLGLITCPLITMALCHTLIFRRIWSSKHSLGKLHPEVPDGKTALTKAIRSSRLLFVMFVIFVVCWTPYALVLVLDHGDAFSMETHLFVTMLAHTHSCTNFYTYMVFKSSFRHQFFALLFRNTRVAPIDEVTPAKNPTVVSTLSFRK